MPKTKNKKKGKNNFKHSQIRVKNNKEKKIMQNYQKKQKKK